MTIYRLSQFEFNKLYQLNIDRNNTNEYIYNDSQIYINCFYSLQKIPYHTNSPYIYRNIENKDEFTMLLNKGLEKKPISYKQNLVKSHYNPTIANGNICNYIYLPRDISTVYNINNSITIEYIDTIYENSNIPKIDIGIYSDIFIYKKNTLVSLPIKTIKTSLYIYNIYQSKYYTQIRWKPLDKFSIRVVDSELLIIDNMELMPINNTINKYNNIEIYYKYV